MLIVFDKMIVDTISNKNINQVVTEVFIRGKALNISAVLIALSYSQYSRIRLNYTHLSVMKISKQTRDSKNRI